MEEFSKIEQSGSQGLLINLQNFKLKSTNESFSESCQNMIDALYREFGRYLPKES